MIISQINGLLLLWFNIQLPLVDYECLRQIHIKHKMLDLFTARSCWLISADNGAEQGHRDISHYLVLLLLVQ